MKIALDAMGGDNGPPVNVRGAVLACQKWSDLEVVLVGNQETLNEELKRAHRGPALPIKIHHANDIVGMHESPVEACRAKPDASIMVCARLVAEGKADGMVSAGNSGACPSSW